MSSLTAEKEVLIILEKVEMENNQSIPLFFIKKLVILFYFIFTSLLMSAGFVTQIWHLFGSREERKLCYDCQNQLHFVNQNMFIHSQKSL